MNLCEIVLLGLKLFRYTLSEDCTKSGVKESTIVKMSDSITFHLEYLGHWFIYNARYVVERIRNETREQICRFDMHVYLLNKENNTYGLEHGSCSSSQFDNRTGIVLNADYSYGIVLDFTILKAESTDTGTYSVTDDIHLESKCFDVFVFGPPEITVIPPIIETGTFGRFRCISPSMTAPGRYNLTNETSWLVNNTSVEKQIGRFEFDDKDLLIHYVSRVDKNLLVSCRAVEDRNLTTMAIMTVPVGWGPDPVPELRPTNFFYNLEPGTLLPHINCSSDCNPPCEMRWEKIGSQRTLSTNGTLSLGKLDRKSAGEYVCIATRNQTSIVFVNEDTPITAQNHLPVIVVGGVLGAALLAASVFIVVLVRRIGCGAVFACSKGPKSENRAAEVELQSTSAANYEELNQRSNATPTYDELNLGVGTTGCESVSMATGTTTGTEVYENTRKTEK